MNTVQAEETFKKEFGKHAPPKGVTVVTDGNAHDVLPFVREIGGAATDEQFRAWIEEAAMDAALFEGKVVDDLLAWLEEQRAYYAKTKLFNEAELAAVVNIERKRIHLVRRTAPHLIRMRNENGEPCWRVAARIGTRMEPYPKADLRSARMRAYMDAKIQEQEEELVTRSQELREMP